MTIDLTRDRDLVPESIASRSAVAPLARRSIGGNAIRNAAFSERAKHALHHH